MLNAKRLHECYTGIDAASLFKYPTAQLNSASSKRCREFIQISRRLVKFIFVVDVRDMFRKCAQRVDETFYRDGKNFPGVRQSCKHKNEWF